MTCLNEGEWIIGAVLFALGGSVYAGGAVDGYPETENVANIDSSQVENISPIPEPQQYTYRYEMKYLSSPIKPFYTKIDDYYITPIPYKHRYQRTTSDLYLDPIPQLRSNNYFSIAQSTEPLIQLVQLPDYSSIYVLHPQRRLSLTVDQWSFSATARVSLTHSHDMGTTFFVRYGF